LWRLRLCTRPFLMIQAWPFSAWNPFPGEVLFFSGWKNLFFPALERTSRVFFPDGAPVPLLAAFFFLQTIDLGPGSRRLWSDVPWTLCGAPQAFHGRLGSLSRRDVCLCRPLFSSFGNTALFAGCVFWTTSSFRCCCFREMRPPIGGRLSSSFEELVATPLRTVFFLGHAGGHAFSSATVD